MRRSGTRLLLFLIFALAAVGCGGSPTGPDFDFGGNDQNLYVAFGDSITAGLGDNGSVGSCPPRGGAFGYPPRLAARLGATVVNEGVCGDRSTNGVARVVSILNRYQPGYLLINFGSNDFHDGRSVDRVIANLRSIVRLARAGGTFPVISTVTPVFFNATLHESFIETLNSRIHSLASQEGIPVVDLWAAFNNDSSLFTGDLLHPNAAGYALMASTWHDTLESL